jgi:ankyrin repeat protein
LNVEPEIIESFRSLAIAKFETAKYADAEGFVRKAIYYLESTRGSQFDGRDELLELLAIACWKQSKCAEAEVILLEIVKDKEERQTHTLRLLHALAEVYLAKNDLNLAENFCLKALKGRGSVLGRTHILFQDSVTLLVEIYEAKGDAFEAQGYKVAYPPATASRAKSPEPPSTKSQYSRIAFHSEAALRHAPADRKAVRWLEKNAANIKANYNGTALHCAAEDGHKAAVRLLMERGADVNTKGDRKWTALLYAAQNGHEAVVQMLLDKGANTNTKDNIGHTALHYAAQNGHEAVVRLLLGKGVDVNINDSYGWTALYYAAQNGHEVVVRLLLENGADANTRDNIGHSVHHYAAQNGHQAVARLLTPLTRSLQDPGKYRNHCYNQ